MHIFEDLFRHSFLSLSHALTLAILTSKYWSLLFYKLHAWRHADIAFLRCMHIQKNYSLYTDSLVNILIWIADKGEDFCITKAGILLPRFWVIYMIKL